MAATKTVEESTKPVDSRDMAQAGWEAEQVSKQLQKRYGKQGQPIVKASPWQRGVAMDKAKSSDFQRQQQFIPKAYEATGKIEEGQTKIGDAAADFWQKYNLRADELAMKQNQAVRGSQLANLEVMNNIEDQLAKIEYTAFTNDAKRQEALEQAYLNGHAETELLKASTQGKINISDIDKYWGMIINDIQQDLKDYETWAQAEKEDFAMRMKVDSENWGAIISGIVQGTGEGLKNIDEKDWEKLETGVSEWWNSGDQMTN